MEIDHELRVTRWSRPTGLSEGRDRREEDRPGAANLRRLDAVSAEGRRSTNRSLHCGRAFTDDVEREISQRLLTSNWSVNAGAFITGVPMTTA
jgi:hypothetical protein